jgi:Beta-propeller repeat/Domain of unknown function DUF11
MKAAFLAVAMLAAAGALFYFSTVVHAAKAGAPGSPEPVSAEQRSAAHNALPSKSLSLPLFFEPNQGQTAPQVKFLAHGAGYGLFLTADEAVLQLQHSAVSSQFPVLSSQASANSVIRMRLDGANASAHLSGASPLPGKSNYFIGNDPSKWHHDIPQFARVEYTSVYPGVDLVYYGDQGQLEYDFRVAPAADPNQIALSFEGASTRIDSGDLILSTTNGDVRFHAPRVYQPAAQQSGIVEKAVAGSFRQLAGNKIGFTIGNYDRGRELVIDPVLSYSTYLGGSGTESLVNVAVDSSGFIYVAGSTDSGVFTFPASPPAIPPIQSPPAQAEDIFIAVINPIPQPGAPQLVYATYLGGSGSDLAAGIAVSTDVDEFNTGIDVYVAGSTTSPDFPTNGVNSPFQATPVEPGTHGFVTRLNIGGPTTTLRYSTYLAGTNAAGTASDTVTGLAIDTSGDAFVTGITTSTNDQSNGFPANPDGFQTTSFAPSQFFASKINTKGTGSQSMIYSTYLGGGNPQSGQTQGGGIAVDTAGNMYITGATNFLPVDGPNQGEVRFPLNLAFQNCLDEASKTACTLSNPTALDAFVAKITPKPGFTLPVYCTYLGGSGDDIGFGIAVDSSNNAYITGSTTSSDWVSPGTGFQTGYGGAGDAFIAKIGNLSGSSYPLNYFTYLGGSGSDVGQAIQVDSVQSAHVAGSTSSANFPITTNTYQKTYAGAGDAFVASISTTLSGQGAGDFSTYLGGSQPENGTGVAIDVFGATYAVGTTQSSPSSTIPFPLTPTAYQSQLNGPQDAFVSQIGAKSVLTVAPSTTSPSPNPVAAGTQVAFTFNITNTGPDNASQVFFTAVNLPTTGLASTPTAKVTSGTGSCSPVQTSTIPCFIPTLAAGAVASVEVDLTPAITGTAKQIQISGNATANNSGIVAMCSPPQQPANIVDFSIQASTSTPTINAGDTASFQVVFKPTSLFGYDATITPSQTTSPSMVTATTPTFNPTTVTLSGSASATTTLSIASVARPVTTGSLLRRGSFYAAWLPIGGLSLVGLGIGAGRKRRPWLVGIVLCLIAGAMLLQSGCGSSSSSTTTGGGTQAGIYTITITGSAGTGASHNTQVQLQVN